MLSTKKGRKEGGREGGRKSSLWHSETDLPLTAGHVILWDINHLTKDQPQTRPLWDHNKMRQSKATSSFCPSIDDYKVTVPPTKCQTLPPSQNVCLLLLYQLHVYPHSRLPSLQIRFIKMLSHSTARTFWQHLCFLRISHKSPNQNPNSTIILSKTLLLRHPMILHGVCPPWLWLVPLPMWSQRSLIDSTCNVITAIFWYISSLSLHCGR